ncbi:hypothetical protein DWW96_09665 [Eubacterium sp. AF17-7]|uniref:ParB/RepB/Spo0J family partition protein n=1 Tax=Eubacterium sp. AF17-7 TaxID=2293105 RepID=UPI000E5334DA|nr:ParB N-terminal domain-containing protein [Eubacterium sp. AF17-7]RGG64367.1 hypothetical protein DWW96_09665 [Eubacterium sp. AF17-7]
MGKFNVNSIRGYDKIKDIKEDVSGEEYKFGSGLLSDASKDVVKMNIVNIEREKINKNPKNKYKIGEIDTLAESIKIYGIVNPLNVRKNSDGTYTLLGGERRITAIDKLIDDPNVPDWNEYTLIPCVIKDLDKIKLPISDEMKEKYAIVTTNKEARKYTDSDRYYEMQAWKEIIEELRSNGVEMLNDVDEDGEENSIQIKGEKTMDILSKVTGMSRGQVQRYDKVEKKAEPELLNAMLDDNISVGVAEKATDVLSSEQQKKLAKDSRKKKIQPSDVEKYKDDDEKTELTSIQFKNDIANISDAVKDGKAYLSEKERKEYDKLIKKLEKLILKEV